MILLKNELSKRIKELAIVGECLVPLQLLWLIIFMRPTIYPLLIIKILSCLSSLGMAIGCGKEKQYGIKCAHLQMWIRLITASLILIVWFTDSILYLFGIIDIILCITLCFDLEKIKKIENEIGKHK